ERIGEEEEATAAAHVAACFGLPGIPPRLEVLMTYVDVRVDSLAAAQPLGRGTPLRRSPGARPGARFCSPVSRGCQARRTSRMFGTTPARPRLRRRPAPNLLSQGHEVMALFGRDRDGGTGAPRAVPVPAMPLDRSAPGEVAMFERERNTSQLVGPGGIDTFLGRGTKVNGKLVLEGTARIDGQ